MNKFISKILLSLIFVSAFSAIAEDAVLYRGVDSEGRAVFSDTPFEKSEKFTPPPISVMDTPKANIEKKAEKEEAQAEFKYTRFDIESPTNKETIRNDPDVKVSLKVVPELNTEAGHNVWLLLDDKAVIKSSRDVEFYIGRIVRGAHKLQAQIRDAQGGIVLRSSPIVVYIHHTAK